VSDGLPDVSAFGALYMEFMRAMRDAAKNGESPLLARIGEHLGQDPKQLASTGADFAITDHPNLQLALDSTLPDAELVGFSSPASGYMPIGFSALVSGNPMAGSIEPGPVQYTDVEVGDGRIVRCVLAALFLTRWEDAAVALVLSQSQAPFGSSGLRMEGVSPVDGVVSSLLGDLRAAMREHNVYRGRVISLHGGEENALTVQFHALPEISRDQVVLPEGTIERLERHTVGIANEAERLRSAGRHLKRGVLLHGPPGTGKTLTVNYLLGSMRNRTTILLTGRGLGLIEPAVAIARDLAPATVVLEDIDLVAAERTMPMGDNGVLFELLNQMEGLAEDTDLLFLLTTNRADLIEPALATRPGRVDLALEIPLPDEAARRQLVRLYARGIVLDEETEQAVVSRTDGLSGAFMKELMRQATLRAALSHAEPTSEDVSATLGELLEQRSTLTRRLLGHGADGANAPQPPPPFPAMVHAFGAAGIPMPEIAEPD
jgi:hypothetical protein